MAGGPRNESLCQAMERAGLSSDALAQVVGVTTKSVWRWRQGVVPHRVGLKAQIAITLGTEEEELWPPSPPPPSPPVVDASDELVASWAHRADAPPWTWWSVLAGASRQIDLLGYAMLFLPEQNASLDRLLLTKGQTGCRVRIALADPDSRQVAERDEEEELGGTMRDRIRTTLDHFKALLAASGIEIRFHATLMYNSLFRGDEQMLVTPHLYRLKGYKAPLLHLRRMREDSMFDNLAAHFERVWTDTTPVTGL